MKTHPVDIDMRATRIRQTVWTTLALVTIVVLLGAVASPAGAHAGDDGVHHHDGWMGGHDGGLWSVWMFLWAGVLLAIPLGLGYLLVSRRDSGGRPDDDAALATLRQRYAQGEIDEEEFETRRERLQQR